MSDKPVKFDSDSVKVEKATLASQALDGAIELEPSAKYLPAETSGAKLKVSKGKSKLLKIFGWSFGGLVISASIYQAWQFIESMFTINSILGVSVSFLLATTVLTGLIALLKGRLKGRKLRKRAETRTKLAHFQASETYGEAANYLNSVSDEFSAEVDISKPLALYQQTIQKSHNDAEIIQIYNDQVLAGLDKLAMDAIRKHATESALMVALSPLAIADMALVAWRSSRMIQEVSRIYGCPQTAFGRLGLTKQVATNLMLAGASEFVAEAGVELLGKGIAATVSTKMAQGIGVGILVSRLGIQTMQLCRPIEFNKDNKPKLSQIRKLLTSKVISMVISKKDKNIEQGEYND